MSSDGKTGDGAGLLIDIPHEYFNRVCDFKLPEAREYAVGMVFLPQTENQYLFCKKTFEKEIENQGLTILGWREVPVDSSQLGPIAAASEPKIDQIFVGKANQLTRLPLKQSYMLPVKLRNTPSSIPKYPKARIFTFRVFRPLP